MKAVSTSGTKERPRLPNKERFLEDSVFAQPAPSTDASRFSKLPSYGKQHSCDGKAAQHLRYEVCSHRKVEDTWVPHQKVRPVGACLEGPDNRAPIPETGMPRDHFLQVERQRTDS